MMVLIGSLRAVSVRESTHSDHATKAAARALIPPIARPRSLTPGDTTLRYSTSQFADLWTICIAIEP